MEEMEVCENRRREVPEVEKYIRSLDVCLIHDVASQLQIRYLPQPDHTPDPQ